MSGFKVEHYRVASSESNAEKLTIVSVASLLFLCSRKQ